MTDRIKINIKGADLNSIAFNPVYIKQRIFRDIFSLGLQGMLQSKVHSL